MKTQQQDPKEQSARDAFKLTNTVPGQDAIDSDNDITEEELALLDAAGEDDEERKLEEAALDNKDADGELLNEQSFADAKTGSDLDVPGSEDDDDNEEIGEEDEENNNYSLGADKKD